MPTRALLGALLLFVGTAATAQESAALVRPHYQMDLPTLRRGAQLFVQNCMVCHSIERMRLNRIGADLDLPPELLRRDYAFTGTTELAKGMTAALPGETARRALGVAPPDLSGEARYRGTDWIYTYLLDFYRDDKRPLGWNNHLFPNVAMPNVLAGLQGVRDADGKPLTPGRLNDAQFQQAVADLTAWLDYASDPSVLQRQWLRPFVLGFLVIFTGLAYWTKRVYWRAVH